MFIASIEEAREHLVELLARIAGGQTVVIADNGKSVAQLIGPPMFPTTPQEIEATREKREAFVRECLGLRNDAPIQPPDGMSWDEYYQKYRIAG